MMPKLAPLWRQLLPLAAVFASATTAPAHIGYGGRDFGAFAGTENKAIVISNQSHTGANGWADATDEDWADSHRGRFYRFTLLTAATITIKVEAFDDGGTKNGNLKPAFSLYAGLAHLAPAAADHDGAPITQAYLATQTGVKEGALRTLTDFKIGNEDATTPYNFATMLTHFTYVGHAADGTAANYGPAVGIEGDGNANGVVEKSFELPSGEYTIFVGGADYATHDTVAYGARVLVSVGPDPGNGVEPVDPGGMGVPYKWKVTMQETDMEEIVGIAGAWSWEDEGLFDEGEPTVGWTHAAAWAGISLKADSHLTVNLRRQPGLVAPTEADPNHIAPTDDFYPSFTIWQNWDEDGEQDHTFNNRGNVAWAEKLVYVGLVDNSTATSITRSFNLPAGDYTIVFGSNTAAKDSKPEQGFKATLTTTPLVRTIAVSGGAVPGLTGVTFRSLGSPTLNDEEQIAFRAILAGTGVTAANDTAILSDTGATPLHVVAREGDTDPATGGVFLSLGDPITDNGDNVLFQARLKPKAGVISIRNDVGLWRYTARTDTLHLIAQENMDAPGVDDGATFASFSSVVIDSGGGAFLGKLAIRGRVNANNDEGVWLFSEGGVMTLIARQGKPFKVGPDDIRIVKSLHFLAPMPVVKAAGRSTSAPGGRVLSIVFKDGSSGIFHIAP